MAALLGVAFATTLHAQQTLIHYRLNAADAGDIASGVVTNMGTLGNGTNVGGITLSSDIPTNGVPSDAGNRSIVCDGSGGILAPGTQQLNNTAIAGAGGFTYETWFKWEGGGTINSIIDYAGTEKLVRPSDVAGPEMETDNSRFDLIGGTASNEWHYAAVVFTPTAALDSNTNLTGNYTFYLDTNTPVATVSNVTITTFGDSLNRSIGVGMHPAGYTSDYFHGLIYEPRVTLGAVQALGLLFKPHGVVTTVADSGAGSFRDVVAHASNGEVIYFDSSLNGQTITLTNGQLTITNDLTVDASALAGGIILSGNGNSRIFLVESNSALTLDTLTLRDGFSGSAIPNAGGAILNYGNLTLNACTLTANRAYDGAALFNWNGGDSTLNECTLSGNNSQQNGGAIQIRGDTVTLNACTVSDNHADFYAGGVLVDSDGILVLHNSIVAGNTAGYSDPDLWISLSGTFSSTSSLTNGDPRLAPLGDYGGPTQTMPPLSGSAAIDAGGSTTFATDQRGLPRVVGSAADIGAVETVQSFVTNTNDSGPGSLRQTIAEALPGTIVAFDPGLSGQTITLTNGQLIPTNSLIISASGLASGITVSGNDNSRIFLVNPNVSLVLDSLNLRDGAAPAGNFPANSGGGILNQGNLTVLACTLQNNQATQGTDPGGGGIESVYGTLTLNNSTLVGNSAGHYGGGIETASGQTVIANCTIVENNAPRGGGMASASGAVDPLFETHVMNSIIASNSINDVDFESDISGTINNFVSAGHNLIGNGEALPSFNQTGDLTNAAPLLAPLGNYGGPTLTTPPLPGSPVIEGGGRDSALPGDQRGAARPAGYHPDIGAVEAFPFSTIPLVDTDGDGMDDRMELGYFGNLTTATTNSDFDHDGSRDRDELGNMTDPRDAASLFKIDYFAFYEPGTNGPVYLVDFTSFPGLSYTIERDQDPSFSAPQMEDVGVVNDYQTGMLIELNSDQEFFRVRRNLIIN